MGAKKGPPYPLGSSSHSTSEKKAGWHKSLNKNSDSTKSKVLNLTDKQKRMLKIGAIAAGTILAGVGATYLIKNGYVDIGKTAFGNVTQELFNSGKGVHVGNIPEEISKIASSINPSFNSPNENSFTLLSDIDKAPLDEVNCTACTIANELKRRLGDSVTKAKLVDTRTMPISDILPKIFKDPEAGIAFNIDSLGKQLKEMGNGARGQLLIMSKKLGGGHSISFEVVKNKVFVIDSQRNNIFPLDSGLLNKLYDPDDGFCFFRLDNLELNDTKYIFDTLVDGRIK